MANIQAPNKFNEDDVAGLLNALIDRISRDIHVGTLCIIDKIEDATSRVVRCQCFPNAKGKEQIVAYARCIRSHDMTLIENALSKPTQLIAVILMLDYDSDANLTSIMQSKECKSFNSNGKLHSWNNAVLIHLGDAIDGTPLEDFEGGD